MWPQGDIRDPLGVWGAIVELTADGTGGEHLITVVTELDRAAAYVYTVLDAHIDQNSGVANGDATMFRIHTNWPNIQVAGNVVAYTPARFSLFLGAGFTTSPTHGIVADHQLVTPNQRFLPIWDPRGLTSVLTILTFKMTNTPDLATFTVAAYGYFWDRSVMSAPGGLRHPGSS